MAYGLRVCILVCSTFEVFLNSSSVLRRSHRWPDFPSLHSFKFTQFRILLLLFTCVFELLYTGFMLHNGNWLSVNLSCVMLDI